MDDAIEKVAQSSRQLANSKKFNVYFFISILTFQIACGFCGCKIEKTIKQLGVERIGENRTTVSKLQNASIDPLKVESKISYLKREALHYSWDTSKLEDDYLSLIGTSTKNLDEIKIKNKPHKLVWQLRMYPAICETERNDYTPYELEREIEELRPSITHKSYKTFPASVDQVDLLVATAYWRMAYQCLIELRTFIRKNNWTYPITYKRVKLIKRYMDITKSHMPAKHYPLKGINLASIGTSDNELNILSGKIPAPAKRIILKQKNVQPTKVRAEAKDK